MCVCTPEDLTIPFCGKPGCEWPEINGAAVDEINKAQFEAALRQAQAVVEEFNGRLAAAMILLKDRGIPILMLLQILAEHQAKLLAMAEPRAERKVLRERIVAFLSQRLVVAELQRLENPQDRAPGNG